MWLYYKDKKTSNYNNITEKNYIPFSNKLTGM